MLHILNSADGRSSCAARQAMFAARKAVFVDLLKWDVPVLAGRYEIDQFDDRHARYLVLTGEAGAHLGSARLLPTLRPHILDSFYAALCDDAPPRGHGIFEITRFCLDRRLSACERRGVRDTLVQALAAHALAAGITRYSAIAPTRWARQIAGFGWRCAPLGAPQSVGGERLVALSIEIDRDTPARLTQAGIVADPGLLADLPAAA